MHIVYTLYYFHVIAEYNEDKSRQLSSPDDDVITETIGGATGGPEDEGGEETVIYKSMPECDTELRLRHSMTVKESWWRIMIEFIVVNWFVVLIIDMWNDA